ncbi:MAG: 50S ribosomal protein L14 [Candidatus Parcubacteria bacterium]|nr:MAG: 50S ribosomal protein L14 [Candidatus Parcubacteria bacterium]
MIQRRSILNCADNSGALKLQCIGFVGKGNARYAEIGDIITCSIKEAEPRREVKKGDVVRALIVRQRKNFRRKDGTYIRFDENACVLIKKGRKGEIELIGNRIFGPIPREIKELGYEKIANLAPELV